MEWMSAFQTTGFVAWPKRSVLLSQEAVRSTERR